MGQQQLLLLVLGVVIVGLAVVVGIQAFSENQAKANADAMVNDGVRIASDIQAWVLKPTAFGGLGDQGGDYSSVSWNVIGYSANASDEYENLNGTYTLGTACTGGSVADPELATGVTAEAGTSVFVSGESDTGNEICVLVAGTGPEHIATEVSIGTDDGGTTTTL